MSKPSKREAEQNQRQLETLLAVPDNRICADCGDYKPKWASASLGVFLCIRCAGLHRNMGREISVIKSCTVDSWSTAEVQHMTQWGNRKANALYLQNGQPEPPKSKYKDMTGLGSFNASEDKEMYHYIKDKYKKRLFMRDKDRVELEKKMPKSANGRHRGTTGGSGGHDRRLENEGPVTIEADDHVTFSGQLKILASMGFTDTTKCLIALKKSKGGIDNAVERLVHGINTSDAVKASSHPAPSSGRSDTVSSTQDISKSLRDALNFLEGMGFTNREENLAALKQSKGDVDGAVNILVESQSKKPAQKQQQEQQPQQVQSSFGMDLLSLNDPSPSANMLFQQPESNDPFSGFFIQQSVQQPQLPLQNQQFGQLPSQPNVQQQAWAPSPQSFQTQQHNPFITQNLAQTQTLQQNGFSASHPQQQMVPQQNSLVSQQGQQSMANYNIGYAPLHASSVFNFQQPTQARSQIKNDPFAALVMESNLMKPVPQQTNNPVQPVLQQMPMGMLYQQKQQQQQQQQQQAQFGNSYSITSGQQTTHAVPFGGYGQSQPDQTIPRNLSQPQSLLYMQGQMVQPQQYNQQQQQQAFGGFQ